MTTELNFTTKQEDNYLWQELALRNRLMNGMVSVAQFKRESPVENGLFEESDIPTAGYDYIVTHGFNITQAEKIVTMLVRGWKQWYNRKLRKVCLGREFAIHHQLVEVLPGNDGKQYIVGTKGELRLTTQLDRIKVPVLSVSGLRSGVSERSYYVIWNDNVIPVDDRARSAHNFIVGAELRALEAEVRDYYKRFQLEPFANEDLGIIKQLNRRLHAAGGSNERQHKPIKVSGLLG